MTTIQINATKELQNQIKLRNLMMQRKKDHGMIARLKSRSAAVEIKVETDVRIEIVIAEIETDAEIVVVTEADIAPANKVAIDHPTKNAMIIVHEKKEKSLVNVVEMFPT